MKSGIVAVSSEGIRGQLSASENYPDLPVANLTTLADGSKAYLTSAAINTLVEVLPVNLLRIGWRLQAGYGNSGIIRVVINIALAGSPADYRLYKELAAGEECSQIASTGVVVRNQLLVSSPVGSQQFQIVELFEGNIPQPS